MNESWLAATATHRADRPLATTSAPDAATLRWHYVHGFAGNPTDCAALADALDRAGVRGVWEAAALPGHTATAALSVATPTQTVSADAAIAGLVARCQSAADAGSPLLLVGYSLGARLALGAVLAGAPVAGLVCIGVTPGFDGTQAQARLRTDTDRAEVLVRDAGRFWPHWIDQPLLASQHDGDPQRRDQLLAARNALSPAGLAAAVVAYSPGAMPAVSPARLASLDVPVAYVAGARDRRYLGWAHQLAAATPGAWVLAVAGAGHAPHVEAPAATAAALVPWLTANALGERR